jgi:hypothetical protein
MQYQCPGFGLEQQIFCAPARTTNRGARDRGDHLQIDGPAQPPVMHPQDRDAPPHDVRFDAAARGFYFG